MRGEGWINTNPWYMIITIFILSIPILFFVFYNLYVRYKLRDEKKEAKIQLTEKQEKKVERERRKEIKRAKKQKGKT